MKTKSKIAFHNASKILIQAAPFHNQNSCEIFKIFQKFKFKKKKQEIKIDGIIHTQPKCIHISLCLNRLRINKERYITLLWHNKTIPFNNT